jgi:subtilisin
MAAPNVAGAAASCIASYRVNDPFSSDVLAALISSASNSETECDGTGHSYFISDRDAFPEPLLYAAITNQSGSTSGSQSNHTESVTNIFLQ